MKNSRNLAERRYCTFVS
jgi:hypothetical protein